MKQYEIAGKWHSLALPKLKLPPYSSVGDCLSYRAGYIRTLQDLELVDRLSATCMLIEIGQMEGWEK